MVSTLTSSSSGAHIKWQASLLRSQHLMFQVYKHTHTRVLLSDDSKSRQSNACNLVRTVKAALTHSKTHTHTYIQYIYIQYTILQSDTVCLSLYIQYIYANSVFNPSPHTHTLSLSLSRISVRFGFGHVLVNNIQRRLFIPIVFHFNFFSETKSDGSCRPSPSLPFVQTHFKARHLHSLSLSLLEVSCLPVDLCSRVRLREILRKWRP